MKPLSLTYCVKESKPCVHWVDKHFKDCLCNLKDEFSFAFGLISLVCWGVAEIPQIITNFRTKSSHGVSLAFLLTWVAGSVLFSIGKPDVFNLTGCLLEPLTLPTQLYTALLYTISTVILALQSLYYDHVYQWLKNRHRHSTNQEDEEQKQPLKPKLVDSGIPIPSSTPRFEFYYTSARSLAGSRTPPFQSYLRTPARSGPSALAFRDDSSSSDDEAAPSGVSRKPVSQPKPIARSAGYGAFFATTMSLPQQGRGLMIAYVGFTGRKLLNESGAEHSALGQWLGWLMAAIYMGGRLPQIFLNFKRGSVEGLNPLMFVFALIANLTYVASILVRSMDWEKIKANLPWLLDAIVCVALDFFIISQYIYYRFIRGQKNDGEDDHEDYAEANKAAHTK